MTADKIPAGLCRTCFHAINRQTPETRGFFCACCGRTEPKADCPDYLDDTGHELTWEIHTLAATLGKTRLLNRLLGGANT